MNGLAQNAMARTSHVLNYSIQNVHAEYVDECTEAGAPSMPYDRLCKRHWLHAMPPNVVSCAGHKASRNMEVDRPRPHDAPLGRCGYIERLIT